MPEGVAAYPRWDGPLGQGPGFPAVARGDIKRAWENQWGRMVIILVFAYTVIFLGSLNTAGQTRGAAQAHTMENFLFFFNNLRWAALAIAAVMAGPALLEDHRRGALELYLSRGISHRDYLLGKVLAVLGMAAFVMVGPGLLYFAGTFLLFEQSPEGWLLVPAGILLYGLMWAALVGGLGLGLSCVARSSRGATLVLIGGFAVVDIFVANVLEGITRIPALQILSPFSAMGQQVAWLFGAEAPFQFPEWWGLAVWIVLVAVGWGLVAWKHPRLAGE